MPLIRLLLSRVSLPGRNNLMLRINLKKWRKNKQKLKYQVKNGFWVRNKRKFKNKTRKIKIKKMMKKNKNKKLKHLKMILRIIISSILNDVSYRKCCIIFCIRINLILKLKNGLNGKCNNKSIIYVIHVSKHITFNL